MATGFWAQARYTPNKAGKGPPISVRLARVHADALLCLIVDDHPVVRQGIRALLEREMPGVEVVDAATPAAALAAGDKHPDVVVIDPSSAGAEVEKLVGELRRTLDSAIVVFTGNGGAAAFADAPSPALEAALADERDLVEPEPAALRAPPDAPLERLSLRRPGRERGRLPMTPGSSATAASIPDGPPRRGPGTPVRTLNWGVCNTCRNPVFCA